MPAGLWNCCFVYGTTGPPDQSCSSLVSLEREVWRAGTGSGVQGRPSQGPELGSTADTQRAGDRAQPQGSVNTGRAELNGEGINHLSNVLTSQGGRDGVGSGGEESGVLQPARARCRLCSTFTDN